AYLQALIEGRPRRNDPYTGRDDRPGSPQPESLFSIQFIPPYALALTARACGLNASSAFVLLTGLVAFLSTLALFRLIGSITGDEGLAASGALLVLCLGTFALVYGPLRLLFGQETTFTFSYLPFLRRYLPAAPFPLLFVFCALVWRALSLRGGRAARAAVLAGLVFALLVFSYFYLWTAALGWFGILALLWLAARPAARADALRSLGIIAALAVAALAPYFALLSNRAPTMDAVQLLAASHAPDFSRSSEKLGLLICAALLYAARRGIVRLREPAALFTLSFALTPLVVFNQQVLTGRSLQPLHYELYIAKYLALLALILAAALWRRGRVRREEADGGEVRRMRTRTALALSLVALGWGTFETVLETGRRSRLNLERDEAFPVVRSLQARAPSAAASGEANQAVVLYTDLGMADSAPALTSRPVLWAPHAPVFSGLARDENRERIYQYLYYTGAETRGLEGRQFEELDYRLQYLIHSLVEWGHNDPAWTVDWRPLTRADIEDALRGYASYAASFGRAEAACPVLSHVVIETERPPSFANLDRWYERDAGVRIGRFTLYGVRLRP
ncbi:MAG TPA: hypothetical protein VF723_07410, partial [Pyrinomonadaceae bacterium]